VSAYALTVVLTRALAWPSAAASVGSAEKPAWTRGDFWEYSATETTLNGTLTLTYRDRVEVTGTGEVAAGSRTWPVYNITATFIVSSPWDSDSFEAFTWRRTSDLAVVRFEGLQGTVVSWYDPPIDTQWPLRIGSSWNGSTTEVSTLRGASSASYGFHVTEGGVRATPAGSFETLRIEREMTHDNDTSSEVTYYSPLVGNIVGEEWDGFLPELLLSAYRFTNAPTPVALALTTVALVTVLTTVVVVWLLRRRARKAPRPAPREDAQGPNPGSDPSTLKDGPRMPPP